jgi:hypothetical protein
VLSTLLLVVGAVILVPAALFAWAEATIFSSEGFADAASQSLQDDAVQDRVATGLTDRIVESNPDLARARPLIQGAAAGFIDSDQFQAIFRDAVQRLHERVFTKRQSAARPDCALPDHRHHPTAAPDRRADTSEPESGLIISRERFSHRLIRLADRVSVSRSSCPDQSRFFAGSIYLARPPCRHVPTGIALAVVAAVVIALLIGSRALTEFLKNPRTTRRHGVVVGMVDSLRETMQWSVWPASRCGGGMVGRQQGMADGAAAASYLSEPRQAGRFRTDPRSSAS